MNAKELKAWAVERAEMSGVVIRKCSLEKDVDGTRLFVIFIDAPKFPAAFFTISVSVSEGELKSKRLPEILRIRWISAMEDLWSLVTNRLAEEYLNRQAQALNT